MSQPINQRELSRLFPGASKSTLARNNLPTVPVSVRSPGTQAVVSLPAGSDSNMSESPTVTGPVGSAGISTDEAKLNKTERAFLAWLRETVHGGWIGIQCIQLKLADDCRYCCDFWTTDSGGGLRGWEVKGFRREDAWIKLKVAARIYAPARFSFTMVERVKGQWKFTDIKP